VERDGRRTKYTATIAVSSVSFGAYDHAGRPLYVHYGGLEVLMRRVDAQLLPIEPADFFGDEKLIRNAVREALKPI